METKVCGSCKQNKPLSEYTAYALNSKHGVCKECKKAQNAKTNPKHNPETNRKNNPLQMRVNGKYVSRKHPLHKPGNYNSFEDAAFSSLEKYESSVEGQVYIITNPNFPEWVKVGMAIDAEDRLRGYQTSSPYRDYELFYSWSVNDRRTAESEAHSILKEWTVGKKNEWFKCSPAFARVMLESTMENYQ